MYKIIYKNIRSTTLVAAILIYTLHLPMVRGGEPPVQQNQETDVLLTTIKAPPAVRTSVLKRTELGDWHDIFTLPDSDHLMLRRDSSLFKLDGGSDLLPQIIGVFEGLDESKFVFSAAHKNDTWLFFDSKTQSPLH